MIKNWIFVYQFSQYRGDLLPCTLADFNKIVDSQDVAWRINTRQEVEKAIADGLPLDNYIANSKFQSFCQRHAAETSFQELNTEQKLLQWTNDLKMGLPCFIFSAKEFKGSRRKLEDIKLSPLFISDNDHLPCDPKEIFERTQVEGFPWQVALAHITSSGHGLRLVCVARPELGNIADNQICLARQLGILDMIGTTGKPVTDDSCIDASRISYAPRRQDILFMDEQLLFGTENNEVGDSEMEILYGDLYRQGRGSCNPIHSENRFHESKTSTTEKTIVEANSQNSQDPEVRAEEKKELPLVFGHDVLDFVNALLPNGAPQGSRHPWMLKLANDLLILLDNDSQMVKNLLLSLKWVKDVTIERNMDELDKAIEAAMKLKQKRESENLYELQPSRDMRRAIEKITQRKYKTLVMEAHQKAIGGLDPAQRDEITLMLERIGMELKKLAPHYSLMKLLFRRLKPKYYVAAMFVGGALAMTLMTRCWYKFWSEPGRVCRLNCILELIGRSGSGKHIAVDFYNIMMQPLKKIDAAQIDALNAWNEEKDMKSGADKNKTARPKGIFRCMPQETSAAAIREAEMNAKEIVDGKEWYLHIFQFNSELDDMIRQSKKGYMDIETLFLKGFHNEEHGVYLKNYSSMIGQYPVHFNVVYTGTKDALSKQTSEETFINGKLFRTTVVPMADSNFEMRENREYTQEDFLRDQQLLAWAYNFDSIKGEIPCKPISDALHDWTERRMADAEEEGSKAMEDLVKRPCWHAINYALPFIVSRHWDQMVKDEDGRMKCGPGFATDKYDKKLALLIANTQLAFQQYYFLGIGEDIYEKEDICTASKSNLQQRSVLALRKLPDVFTFDDIDKAFDYHGAKNSIYSRIKRLQDDGLIQKIRSGEDKGKYRKLV